MIRIGFGVLLALLALFFPAHEARATTQAQATSSCSSLASTLASNPQRYTNVSGCQDLGPRVPPGWSGQCAPTAGNTVGPVYICISWHDGVTGTNSAAGFSWDFTPCQSGWTYSTTTHTCQNHECDAGQAAPNATTTPLGYLSCVNANPTDLNDTTKCWVLSQVGPDGYKHNTTVGLSCDGFDPPCPAGYVDDPAITTPGVGACKPAVVCPDGVPINPATGQCTAPNVCPQGQKRDTASGGCIPDPGAECPSGQAKGPDGACLPVGVCPAGTVKGPDGTCKPDADGDGQPDPSTDHKASDYADCVTPPACSGDDIMCLHAKELWRVDCNTRRNAKVDIDVYCERPPVCEQIALGDDGRTFGCSNQEEAALTLQWKTYCASAAMQKSLEDIAAGTGDGTGTGTAGKCAGPEVKDVNGNCVADRTVSRNPDGHDSTAAVNGQGDGSDLKAQLFSEHSYGTGGLDVGGLPGFSRSCPQIAPITVLGVSVNLNRPEFCSWMQLGGAFVLLMAALASLKIMAGGSLI